MNLANLENAREQLRLSDDGVCVHIQDAIDSVDSAIRELEALPVVPTVEVGQVWVSDTGLTLELLGAGTRNVLCRNHWGAETIVSISMLTKHWTLHTPAPNPTPLTADDVSDGVYGAWIDERCKEIVYETKKQYEKRFLAAAINKFNEEKACG